MPDPTRKDILISSSLDLDDMLCFSLYAASRSVTAVYRPLLDALGLTYPQYLVMIVLWENGPATVKKISELLRLDYGTLTPLLKRLEAIGHIARRRRAEDERSVEITATEQGLALRERAAGTPIEMSHALALDPSQAAQLKYLLHEVIENTSRHLRERGAA